MRRLLLPPGVRVDVDPRSSGPAFDALCAAERARRAAERIAAAKRRAKRRAGR